MLHAWPRAPHHTAHKHVANAPLRHAAVHPSAMQRPRRRTTGAARGHVVGVRGGACGGAPCTGALWPRDPMWPLTQRVCAHPRRQLCGACACGGPAHLRLPAHNNTAPVPAHSSAPSGMCTHAAGKHTCLPPAHQECGIVACMHAWHCWRQRQGRHATLQQSNRHDTRRTTHHSAAPASRGNGSSGGAARAPCNTRRMKWA
jgi:hypothetical protein